MNLTRHKLKSKVKKSKEISLKKVRLSRYLKKGLSIKEACLLSGITKVELGEIRSDVEFEDFIQNCEAQCELEHLENISDAGSIGAWQASAWMLERTRPEKYGKKDIVKHEYEVKFMSFQKLILEVINDAAPQLKQKIMAKLRQIDTDNVQMISYDKKSDNSVIDAEIMG